MKYFLFLFIATLFFTKSYGQLEKRNWLIGGNGSLYSYNETLRSPSYNHDASYTNIDLSATIGYFLKDKFVSGIRPSLSKYKGRVTSPGGGVTNNSKLTVGPFLRYYFLNQEKQFNILADISYQLGTNRNFGSQEVGKYNVLSAMVGTEVFFTSSVGMEILLGYSNKIHSTDYTQSASVNNKKGFQFSIGFQFHLIKE